MTAMYYYPLPLQQRITDMYASQIMAQRERASARNVVVTSAVRLLSAERAADDDAHYCAHIEYCEDELDAAVVALATLLTARPPFDAGPLTEPCCDAPAGGHSDMCRGE